MRSLSQVKSMIFTHGCVSLPSLLAPGHSLQVDDLGQFKPDEADCDALVYLPSLTQLQLRVEAIALAGAAHIDCVRSLPLLQLLQLHFTEEGLNQ